MIKFFIFSYFYSLSISGLNYFYPSYSRSIYYLTHLYTNKENSYYLRIIKWDKTFSLEYFNYTFSFKKQFITLGDREIYLKLPFSSVISIRGFEIQGTSYTIRIGKERSRIENIPIFNQNLYTFFLDYNFSKNVLTNSKIIFFSKRDKNHPAFFLGGFYTDFSNNNLFIENKLGITYFKNFAGISNEFLYDYIGEKKGINFRMRFSTPNYYTTYLTKTNTSFSIYSRGYQKINFLVLSYNASYHITYSKNYVFRFLSSGINLTFFPRNKLPGISLNGGIESRNLGIEIKRGLIISYDYKNLSLRFQHIKSLYEINNFEINLNLPYVTLRSYFYFSNGRTSRFDIRYLKSRYFKFGIFFGEDIRKNYRKFLGFSFYSGIQQFNLNLNYYVFNYLNQNYQTLSFNITTSIKPKELGLGICEGVIFYDENKNLKLDKGEKFFEGINVILDGKRKAKTDKRGRFSFKFIPPGEHYIEIRYGAIPAELGSAVGERFKFKIGFIGIKTFIIPITEYGEIEGYIFFDENKNGIKDKNEKGIENAVISINGFRSITDKEGKFYFTALKPGTYTLKVEEVPIPYKTPEQKIQIKIEPGKKITSIFFPVYKKEKKIKYFRF